MIQKSRYVFGAALAGIAAQGLPGLVEQVSAAPLTAADFTFESNSAAASSFTSVASYIADIGTGTAYGVHASGSVFTFSDGNGSLARFGANNFVVGDYFEFAVPTTAISSIVISFDSLASSTAPTSFELAYSTDGTNFSSLTSYTPVHSNAASSYNATYDGTRTASAGSTKNLTTFSTSFSATGFATSFDLSAITGLNNNPNAAFELIALNTASTATVGTYGVDNFIVSGVATPEPASVALMSVAAAGLLIRRRK